MWVTLKSPKHSVSARSPKNVIWSRSPHIFYVMIYSVLHLKVWCAEIWYVSLHCLKKKLLAKIYLQGVPSKSNVFNFEMRHSVAGSFCCDRHKLIIIPSGNLSFDLTNWISYIAEAQLLLHIIESVFECCKVWCKQNSSF